MNTPIGHRGEHAPRAMTSRSIFEKHSSARCSGVNGAVLHGAGPGPAQRGVEIARLPFVVDKDSEARTRPSQARPARLLSPGCAGDGQVGREFGRPGPSCSMMGPTRA